MIISNQSISKGKIVAVETPYLRQQFGQALQCDNCFLPNKASIPYAIAFCFNFYRVGLEFIVFYVERQSNQVYISFNSLQARLVIRDRIEF